MAQGQSGKIKHAGVIESVDANSIKVRIIQSAACAGCHARQVCNASEQKEKIIDAYVYDRQREYKVGDKVQVVASQHMGTKAVLMAFVYPTILMLVMIGGIVAITGNELWAALGGMAVLFPYIFFLYLMRGKLQKEFTFAVEEL